MLKHLLLIILSCISLTAAQPQHSALQNSSELKLPAMFSNHMVLQRSKNINIWGWSSPGAEVKVLLNGKTVQTTATEKGTWLAEVPPMPAGGPHIMTITSGQKIINFEDILIGDVWFCSGQSNMEWPLQGLKNGKVEGSKQAIANAKYPNLRLFKSTKTKSASPKYDIKGTWQTCSPQSVMTFSATAFFFGRKLVQETGVPIGLIQSAWGGSSCEAWHREESLKKDFPKFDKAINKIKSQKGRSNQKSPTVLFNGMLRPFIPYSLKGFIWYQGESNSPRAHQYRTLFPAMIQDWRQLFGQGDLPFYFCQICPFNYKVKETGVRIREAQRETLNKLPNLGMAVLMDKTTIRNIHPPYKKEAGERLAFWALKNQYNKDVAVSGPLFKEATFKNDTVKVTFEYGEGLALKAQGKSAAIFEIAGKDEKFHKAEASISGNSIILKSSVVTKPSFVRYGWSNTATGNLINSDGLPASSFTTQTWQ